MNLFLTVLIFFSLTKRAHADELQIVDVRRNIPLSDSDPVYKDFYITANSGLKKNLVVTVYRKWTVRDSLGSQALGDINAPVGQLKIIGVYGKLAVAREFKLIDRDSEPMLEQVGIMTGDHVVLEDAFMDNKAPIKKKPVAAAPVSPNEPALTPTLATNHSPASSPEDENTDSPVDPEVKSQ